MIKSFAYANDEQNDTWKEKYVIKYYVNGKTDVVLKALQRETHICFVSASVSN